MSSDTTNNQAEQYIPPERSFEQGSLDKDKRNTLGMTAVLGAVGGAAVAVPFVSTFSPSEKAKAAGAPVEVDVSGIAPGEKKVVEWRGNPVWILHRTPEMIEAVKTPDPQLLDPDSTESYQLKVPEYVKNETRSIKPELLVVVGICSHLGCSPSDRLQAGAQPSLPTDWPGGFLCPCHGSTFDLSGRVFQNKPANKNLDVPPHMYLSDSTLLIGEDQSAA
ncbi:MAG: ubiquinol-cytochrome c reductase iron-sulfur subunit [Burkholderiaceae bacterium]